LNGLAKAAARPHFDPAALATPDPLLLNVDVDRIIDCRDRITEVGDAAEDRAARSKRRVLSAPMGHLGSFAEYFYARL
jgi:hypothetical protein